jgi:esterase/lipase
MKKYTLLTNNLEEPSDEQLSGLMKEVAAEAKRKSLLAEQKLRDTISSEINKIKLPTAIPQ